MRLTAIRRLATVSMAVLALAAVVAGCSEPQQTAPPTDAEPARAGSAATSDRTEPKPSAASSAADQAEPFADVPDSAEDIEPLGAGDRAPEVTLTRPDGSTVQLSQAISAGPTVLIFYRGGWCPYCSAHLAAVGQAREELKALGLQTIAVSPDRPAKLAETAGEHELGYTLLSDSDMAAARAFGLAFRVPEELVGKYKNEYDIDLEAWSGRTHHLLPVPAAYLVSADGRIHFDYVNPDYRTRIEPEALIQEAREMLGAEESTAMNEGQTGEGQGDVPPLLGFTMDSIDGEPVRLADYRGKVLLLVNVASKCGFTKQYTGLQELYETYADRGLVVVGVPANNFGGQEPGTNEEIQQFCTSRFNVTFPMMAKVSVKGDDQAPLYTALTSPEHNAADPGPVKWNFEKFLIGRDGKLVARFRSRTTPTSDELTSAVESALAARP